MKIKIRRINKSLPLPEYKTRGAVAMDCTVREEMVIEPQALGYIPLNFALHPPKGHFVLLAARSSLPKRGLFVANGIGIFDEDFSGNNDEYKLIVYNFTKEPVKIKKGDRLGQIITLPFDRVEWEEVEDLSNPDRGGIGTTGH